MTEAEPSEPKSCLWVEDVTDTYTETAGRMAQLELKIIEGCQEPYIEYYVDGVNLGARIEEALGAAGFDNCLPWYGSDYSIDDTVLGEKARTQGLQGAIILACGCGCYACSGVSADVYVTESTIIFCHFSTWRRGERIVAPLEPVEFDRARFLKAVKSLHSMITSWQPPPASASTPPTTKAIPLGPPKASKQP